MAERAVAAVAGYHAVVHMDGLGRRGGARGAAAGGIWRRASRSSGGRGCPSAGGSMIAIAAVLSTSPPVPPVGADADPSRPAGWRRRAGAAGRLRRRLRHPRSGCCAGADRGRRVRHARRRAGCRTGPGCRTGAARGGGPGAARLQRQPRRVGDPGAGLHRRRHRASMRPTSAASAQAPGRGLLGRHCGAGRTTRPRWRGRCAAGTRARRWC